VALGRKTGKEKLFLHVILNKYWEPLEFELPEAGTAQASGAGESTPHWIRPMTSPNGKITIGIGPTYPTGPRSVVVLIAR